MAIATPWARAKIWVAMTVVAARSGMVDHLLAACVHGDGGLFGCVGGGLVNQCNWDIGFAKDRGWQPAVALQKWLHRSMDHWHFAYVTKLSCIGMTNVVFP